MDISKYENVQTFDDLTYQCHANCIFLWGAWGHFVIIQVHTPYLLALPLTHYDSLISGPGCNHDRKFLFVLFCFITKKSSKVRVTENPGPWELVSIFKKNL